MKVIHFGERITISFPVTYYEIMGVVFFSVALFLMFEQKQEIAFDMFQVGLLYEILSQGKK